MNEIEQTQQQIADLQAQLKKAEETLNAKKSAGAPIQIDEQTIASLKKQIEDSEANLKRLKESTPSGSPTANEGEVETERRDKEKEAENAIKKEEDLKNIKVNAGNHHGQRKVGADGKVINKTKEEIALKDSENTPSKTESEKQAQADAENLAYVQERLNKLANDISTGDLTYDEWKEEEKKLGRTDEQIKDDTTRVFSNLTGLVRNSKETFHDPGQAVQMMSEMGWTAEEAAMEYATIYTYSIWEDKLSGDKRYDDAFEKYFGEEWRSKHGNKDWKTAYIKNENGELVSNDGNKPKNTSTTTGLKSLNKEELDSLEKELLDLSNSPYASKTDRERYKQMIEEIKTQKLRLENVYVPSVEDAKKQNKNWEDIYKSMKKQRQGGLLWNWIGEANTFGEAISQATKVKKDGLAEYNKSIKSINDRIYSLNSAVENAKNELDKAKDIANNNKNDEEHTAEVNKCQEAYDNAVAEAEKIGALQEQLKKIESEKAVFEAQGDANIKGLKKERTAMHGEYGMFLINAIATGLRNMPIPGQFGKAAGNDKSDWQVKQSKNINAETDRYNTMRDKQFEQVGTMIGDIYGNKSEMMKTYNAINADADAKAIAMNLGICQKVADVEAVQKMQKAMGDNITDVLSIMSLIGNYGPEDMIFAYLGGLDLDTLNTSIKDILENTGNLSSSMVNILNRLVELLTPEGGEA